MRRLATHDDGPRPHDRTSIHGPHEATVRRWSTPSLRSKSPCSRGQLGCRDGQAVPLRFGCTTEVDASRLHQPQSPREPRNARTPRERPSSSGVQAVVPGLRTLLRSERIGRPPTQMPSVPGRSSGHRLLTSAASAPWACNGRAACRALELPRPGLRADVAEIPSVLTNAACGAELGTLARPVAVFLRARPLTVSHRPGIMGS